MKFKFKSIRAKLLAVSLLVALLPIIISSVISATVTKDALQKELRDELEILAKSREGQVFAYLDSLSARTLDFSSDGLIRDNVKKIIQTGSKEAVLKLNGHLTRKKELVSEEIHGIFIVDVRGKIIGATDEKELGKNESEDDYFIEGREGVLVSNFNKHEHFGVKNTFIASAPIKDETTGEVFGVLINVFDATRTMVMEFTEFETLQVYIVDSSKNMFMHSGKHAEEDTHSLGMTVDTLPVNACIKNGKEITDTYTNYAGEQVIGASVCITKRGWTLLAEIPAKKAFLPILRTTAFLGMVSLSTAFFVALGVLFFSIKFTRPIKKLHEAAEVIAKGDFDYRVDIKTGDEVEQLAGAFNQMAGSLRDTQSVLEQKIKEKTVQLSEQVLEVNDSRKAILNLLEDIEEEKKKVEATVVIRTKELGEEKARLLASINSLSFGLIIADKDDRIILSNPALQKILEFASEPHTIHDITLSLKNTGSKIDLDIATSCKRCMELKEPVEFKELSYGKKFLRIICAPISAMEGSIGYLFLVEDITEAKVMERSRDEFFAVASHELRTPLTAIRGNADMILEMYADKIPDKDMREMLQDIDASSVRLITIVNDFLEVSRLEQGKIEIKKENFDLNEVVEKVVRNLKSTIEKAAIALLYTPPISSLPHVFADKGRTEQILVNLVGNAAKFTKEGSITIHIELTGGFLKVTITDTGIGISEHNQALLFRKFQQAGEQTLARDVTQSTGLGLYICRMLIAGMGGTIGIEKSELGKGSTFAFTLPVAV